MKKKLYSVVHTHWDFEWFFTKNHSFVLLNNHMNELIEALETKKLDNFLLDAQSILVEEYLKSNSDKKEILKKLIKNNKIQIGPWYTQTDLIVISGEGIVKNLELGINYAKKFGKHMNIGYVPDVFGITKDFPKILNGFNITDSLFRRGFSKHKHPLIEFNWESMDGSKVKSFVIKNGYATGLGLQMNDPEALAKGIKQVQEMTNLDHYFLMIGNDQTPIDFDLKEKISNFNDNSDEYEIELLEDISKFMDKIDGNKLSSIYETEFLDGEFSKIHKSSYSSRYDHKYLMDNIEKRLIKILNPLVIMWRALGKEFNNEWLDNIWKVLSQNYTHDSIAACNTDPTNEQILNRYKNLKEEVDAMIEYLTSKISLATSQIDSVTVFNTSMFDKKEYVTFEVSTNLKSFDLIDNSTGKTIDYHIISKELENYDDLSIHKDQDPDKFYLIYNVRAKIEINKFSYKNLVLKDNNNAFISLVSEKLDSVENDFYKIFISKNNKLSIFVKETSEVIEDFIYLSNQTDDGDTYDFSYVKEEQERLIEFSVNDVSFIRDGNVSLLKYNKNIKVISDGLSKEDQQVEMPFDFELKLEDSENILMKFNIENKAINHRLRLNIKSNIEAYTSTSDTAFSFIDRPIKHPMIDKWKDEKWEEEPTGIYPFINYCGLNNGDGYLSVFAKGIKEFEVPLNRKNEVALTLYRSVGFLGKPNIERRPGIASGVSMKYIETPDSQLLNRKLSYDLSIQFGSNFDLYKTKRELESYLTPLTIYNNQNLNKFSGALKFFPIANFDKFDEIKNFISEFNLKDEIAISNIEPKEDNSFIIRLHNISANEIVNSGSISSEMISKSFETNLLVEKISKNICIDNKIEFGSFKPEQIKTFLFKTR